MTGSVLLDIVLPAPRMPRRSRSARASVIVTIVLHSLAAASIVFLTVGPPESQVQLKPKAAAPVPKQMPRMVFLRTPGPGGGGGGGNRQPAPNA